MRKLPKSHGILAVFAASMANQADAEPHGTGFAVNFSEIQTYERTAHNREITQCDRLAAHPNDPEKVSKGVSQTEMNKPVALVACQTALANDPGNPRLNYQLARIYGYSGRHVEGDPFRLSALKAGYPQSLFVFGYIRMEGWDGRKADPCYGGELVRRSAQVERYAGLVGFPHYVSTGRFEGCGTYPKIDKEEIKGFLKKAEAKSKDYYQRILVRQLQSAFE